MLQAIVEAKFPLMSHIVTSVDKGNHSRRSCYSLDNKGGFYVTSYPPLRGRSACEIARIFSRRLRHGSKARVVVYHGGFSHMAKITTSRSCARDRIIWTYRRIYEPNAACFSLIDIYSALLGRLPVRVRAVMAVPLASLSGPRLRWHMPTRVRLSVGAPAPINQHSRGYLACDSSLPWPW